MDAIVYDKVGKEAEKVRDALYGIYPQETITDAAIASFDDGADGIPVKALTVGIELVQDLHGYDHPWPGGDGKNLININGVSTLSPDIWEVSVSGNVLTVKRNTGSNNAPIVLHTLQAGTYCVSFAEKSLTIRINNITAGSSISTNAANGFTFTLESQAEVQFQFYIGSDNTTCTVSMLQLELGSTATDYAPYSNLCPISGWTGAEISGTGVNVWDEEWEVGGYADASGMPWNTTDRIRSKVNSYISARPSTRYFCKCPTSADLYFYDIEKNYISHSSIAANTVFITHDKCYYIRFATYATYGTTYNHDISINYPATDTEYHPYTGKQISVTFPTEAGTVCGGTLTLNPDRTGTLVVDMAMLDLGTPTYSKSSAIQNGFVATSGMPTDFPVAPHSAAVPNWLCSQYKVYSNNGIAAAGVDGAIAWRVANNAQGVIVRDSNYTEYYANNDMESFKAAMSGVQLVYELVTSRTYHLTSAEVSDILTTLHGTNNIWADTGNIEKLTYRADLGKYIDSHITTAVANALNA